MSSGSLRSGPERRILSVSIVHVLALCLGVGTREDYGTVPVPYRASISARIFQVPDFTAFVRSLTCRSLLARIQWENHLIIQGEDSHYFHLSSSK